MEAPDYKPQPRPATEAELAGTMAPPPAETFPVSLAQALSVNSRCRQVATGIPPKASQFEESHLFPQFLRCLHTCRAFFHIHAGDMGNTLMLFHAFLRRAIGVGQSAIDYA